MATPWTYFHHLSLFSVILTDSSTGSPVHVLMLSIQAVRGLPRLCVCVRVIYPRVLQKRLNRLRCCLRTDSCGRKKTMYWMTDRDPHTEYIFGGGASTGFHAVMNECFAAAATPGFAARLSLSPLYVTVLNNAAMRLAGHRYLDHSSS